MAHDPLAAARHCAPIRYTPATRSDRRSKEHGANQPPYGRDTPTLASAPDAAFNQGSSPYSQDATHSPYTRDQARYRLQGYNRSSARVIAGGCIVAIALLGVLVAGAASCTNPLAPFMGDGQASMTSTPVEQWRAGEMPHLYQVDPAWADEPYAGATVGESGCGPTCLSMAYVYLTGKTDLTPPEMAAFSERNGYVENGMTAWRLITEGSALLGLRAEELPASEGVVAGVLDAGYPVICSMGPGDFTTVGHFIVLCGRDENGDARVYDPNSPERSAQGWPIETVLGQALNLWELARK